LTPADFAKLAELRAQGPQDAASSSGTPAPGATPSSTNQSRKRKKGPAIESNADSGYGFLSEGEILGPRKKAKADYEERMASIAKGREGRERFGSLKGKKNKDVQSRCVSSSLRFCTLEVWMLRSLMLYVAQLDESREGEEQADYDGTCEQCSTRQEEGESAGQAA
jgi:hypothetical protein